MNKVRNIFILIIILGIFAVFALNSFTYSKGVRSGYLIKFSHKGLIFKTYEGELNYGLINSNMKGLTQNLWYFSAKKEDELINKLLQSEGHEVKLYYREKLFTFPWQGKTNYIVYQIDKLD